MPDLSTLTPPLTSEQLRNYHEDGFLIVPSYFSSADLQPVRDEVSALVDALATRLHRTGRIRETFANEPFSSRLTRLEQAYPGAATLIHKNGVLHPALAALWSQPHLLDLIGQILGDDFDGHPVWNLRSKTPENQFATVPWHQDTAYLSAGAENTLQPTAWIPLVDANASNGTLQVLRGAHRCGVLPHQLQSKRGDQRNWYLYIDEADLPSGEVVTCEMPTGSLVLINQTIPHRSTENRSSIIRWSVDLRWQRPNEPSGFAAKPTLPMRRGGKTLAINWADFAQADRNAATGSSQDEFDTTIRGPWLDRWQK